jgi:photosystem II stability/assembly factor-like uncharacterized protein
MRRFFLAIVVLLLATPARANGRYPAGKQVVFDPTDPNHFIVSATFGILESRDAGKTFSWACDSALGLPDQQDGMFAITSAGTTVAATLYTGVRTSNDGCSFRSAPDLEGYIVSDLSLSRSSPHELLAIALRRAIEGRYDAQIVRSDDDGYSWTKRGATLPVDFQPLTIDIAPTDVERVYLSGILGSADGAPSILLRSSDRGLTFTSSAIPDTSGSRYAFIAGVHPLDPDTVYLRVADPDGTVLWASNDAGVTFRKLFTGTGALLGFAISPDGNVMAFGGPKDGLWVGRGDGTDFRRQSDVRPNCLGFGAGALHVCTDSKQAGFSVGRSQDQGVTFEPLLRFDSLCGNVTCGKESQVGMLCPNDWETTAPVIGTTCRPDAGSVSTAEDGGAPGGAMAPELAADGASDRVVLSTWESSGGCQIVRFPARPYGLLALFGLLRRRVAASVRAGRPAGV